MAVQPRSLNNNSNTCKLTVSHPRLKSPSKFPSVPTLHKVWHPLRGAVHVGTIAGNRRHTVGTRLRPLPPILVHHPVEERLAQKARYNRVHTMIPHHDGIHKTVLARCPKESHKEGRKEGAV